MIITFDFYHYVSYQDSYSHSCCILEYYGRINFFQSYNTILITIIVDVAHQPQRVVNIISLIQRSKDNN